MRQTCLLFAAVFVVACGSNNAMQCMEGDVTCTKEQCNDGIDNDGDGLVDYPNDPGCFSPNQDSEQDDCPDGPNCPECSNGKDDDGNGLTDFSGGDPGCYAAGDFGEYTDDPYACGGGVQIQSMPFDGHITGSFTGGAASQLMGKCGGSGPEQVFEIRLREPKVIVATTDTGNTTADTVLYVRGAGCTDANTELACSDDISTADQNSTVTAALEAGVYYLVLDAHDASVTGTFDLQVTFYNGEGTACSSPTDCGPGLVCRVPLGGSSMQCEKHVCSDGVDDDGDGKADYPDDPGCSSPDDDDEADTCPSGASCPECGNGKDDDGDGLIDYPADPSCKSAGSTSEACNTTEGVTELTQPLTMGDTSLATDDYKDTCTYSTGGRDLAYELRLPTTTTLSITVNDPTYNFYPYEALLGASCGGTELACASSGTAITKTNLAGGNYYLVVDGDDATSAGTFQISVSGTIANGQSCEGALAQSGALSCAPGSLCKGSAGSRTCQAAACSDGADNDNDGKKDYPLDPGCESPDDDNEADPGTAPKCANGTDDDSDGKTDYANDLSCWAASGTAEAFCNSETDRAELLFAPTLTGTTTGKHANYTASCSSSSSTALDVTYALVLPVPVATLTVDTLGSSFDTVLAITTSSCMPANELGCNDDSGGSQSVVTLTNVAAGTYAVVVDGYSTANGAYTLHAHGTVAAGTDCTSELFTTGVLACPSGTTCSGSPKKCQ
ncbi:MAG: hypothetical protein ACM31C_11735 [Acidobacteriota bacterium]